MKYCHYKGVVEREFNMSLKKIMHQLCVIEDLNAVQGAKRIGIAKEVFVHWRNYFRLEKRQMLFDQTVDELDGIQAFFDQESGNLNANNKAEQPLIDDKFEDVVEDVIGYYKPVHYTSKAHAMKKAKSPVHQYNKSLRQNHKKTEPAKELQP